MRLFVTSQQSQAKTWLATQNATTTSATTTTTSPTRWPRRSLERLFQTPRFQIPLPSKDARPAAPQAKLGLFPAICLWFAGLAAFTVIGVETLFVGEHFVLVVARVTAYLTAAVVGAAMLATLALFGLACGAMLHWLEGDVNARLLARSIGTSLWVVTAYMWLGVLLVAAWPPTAMTAQEVMGDDLQGMFQRDLAFVWIARLRHAALAGFLVFCVWCLARHVKWFNAALSVGFGAAFATGVVAALGAVAGTLETAP